MFAIEIHPETVDKIESSVQNEQFKSDLPMFLSHNFLWYYVTGYVSFGGIYYDEMVVPAFIIKKHFEYDAEKIKTDWDQIVRKVA